MTASTAQWCEQSGKVCYQTPALALAALTRLRRKPKRGHHAKETSHYRCRACGDWHLTSMPYRRWKGDR